MLKTLVLKSILSHYMLVKLYEELKGLIVCCHVIESSNVLYVTGSTNMKDFKERMLTDYDDELNDQHYLVIYNEQDWFLRMKTCRDTLSICLYLEKTKQFS